jgi:apolipoprotein N-acyltransferase
VPPWAGHAALLPLTAAVWSLLALPHALHVAFARRFGLQRTLSACGDMSGACVALAVTIVFPAAWAAAWVLLGALSPLGAFASPASTQARARAQAQASLTLYRAPKVASRAHDNDAALSCVPTAAGAAARGGAAGCAGGRRRARVSHRAARRGAQARTRDARTRTPRDGGRQALTHVCPSFASGLLPLALSSLRRSTAAAGVLPPRAARRGVALAGTALVAALAYGTARLHSSAPRHHASSSSSSSSSLRVSCLLRVLDTPMTAPAEALWAATALRVASGEDDIILWSETAVTVRAPAGEAALLARAGALSATGRAYLGVTYELQGDGGAPSLNVFALLRPGQGHNATSDAAAPSPAPTPAPTAAADAHPQLAFRYVKGHPVPLVEAGFAAGPRRLHFEDDAPWGRTTAAICFDHDFPPLMRQAGAARAALALQPAQTWGPRAFRRRHALGNGLRAVENGYTLLRCGSDGVTGAIGPHLETLAWKETGSEGVVRMTLPAPAALRRDTVFARAGGWLFGWACVAAAAAATAALLTPEQALPPGWRRRHETVTWHEVECEDGAQQPAHAPPTAADDACVR